ncbi:N-formylglutamate amidohydrolase [Aquibium sp. A9E412]|uniref:N-formylglutamate amidohydrolase n=1 Tax=Aquibium sp. A9E412 TaxID=2976767 RepID=UPI0025B01726|nr:N-formylglutamate amidohydrolase [Aquibium sp. A9E412]MDN2565625.1 N-formylglutamate amidohydrolase [Aquibium sp. A9E412]
MRVVNRDGASPVVLVCEHASNRIPAVYGDLGLDAEARASHAAYDPGALPVAERLSALFDAPLVAGTVSRLVYDLNRPPEAPSAMPARSERFEIAGNRGLAPAERAARVACVYRPFERALAGLLEARGSGVLVTVHSFTPVFHGRPRSTEIGILHDADARLADRMLALAPAVPGLRAERNRPYGPQDGVTHTLVRHALPRGWPNVMLEIRNDLIASAADQDEMARRLHALIERAMAQLPTDNDRRDRP